ncbi:TOR complex subunit lst8 [Microsporum canis]|uniref:Target of rapamycin complex subunit LST8 n=1 Tax=Arthroderma otae (strain ATCC MYA-4605 / CBS 113480) TaxID=554155 RepID=C5G0Q7_ARTOC|nr:WD-repeat protein pop3 [Microsporum canis CBS 113480]EEQ35710.1 WD-repeat protein pop3 [Microsporum canis CBS 113480]
MSVILCTAGYDHIIRFWEALSGICSRTIQHPESQVNRLCITPDKRFVAAAGRHRVYLYDIRSSNPNPVMKFDGHTNNITGVAFHCEGKWMVTSSEDCTVKVWDVRSGTLQRNYTHKAPVNDVVIHPNQGELISADGSGFIRVWDLGESRCTHQLIPEEDVSMASVSVASDGSLLCAGNNKGNVYLWRMLQNQDETSIVPVATFQAHKDYLTRVLLSPDVKHLATCSADHTAKVWSLDPEYGPAKMAVAAREKAKEAGEKASLNGEEANGRQTGRASTKSRIEWNGKGSPASSAVIKSGGNTEISASEIIQNDSFVSDQPFVSLLDGPPMDPTTNTLYLETTLASHQRWVWDCAFSADSAYLVTVSSDHCARLWELSSGQVIRQYQGHHRGAVCVALNDYSEPR